MTITVITSAAELRRIAESLYANLGPDPTTTEIREAARRARITVRGQYCDEPDGLTLLGCVDMYEAFLIATELAVGG